MGLVVIRDHNGWRQLLGYYPVLVVSQCKYNPIATFLLLMPTIACQSHRQLQCYQARVGVGLGEFANFLRVEDDDTSPLVALPHLILFGLLVPLPLRPLFLAFHAIAADPNLAAILRLILFGLALRALCDRSSVGSVPGLLHGSFLGFLVGHGACAYQHCVQFKRIRSSFVVRLSPKLRLRNGVVREVQFRDAQWHW
jgi:hypothetical protein